jgi:hypothetical protein
MMRASWKTAVLAALASAGVAWGQSAVPPTRAAQPAARIVTVQQKDCPPEQCRLLKAWTTKDGHKVCLLQTVDSEEMLTVVQTGGAAAAGGQVGVRIYRWGNSVSPPAGAPVPPPEGTIRQAGYTVEVPASPAPPPPAVTVPPVSVAAPPAVDCSGAPCGTGKAQCGYVHRYEKPAPLYFLAGGCVPVCSPEQSPNYGYSPTQWRPWSAVPPAAP